MNRHAPPRMLLSVGLLALVLRLVHNELLLADPLHFNPLGGNLLLLVAAQAIAEGDLLPFDGPISLNSPLYPYFLGGLYRIVGVNAFHAVRAVTAVVDAGTCVLVALLAFRRFGRPAGWTAGLAMACYGPMIFFATDLNPVALTLFLLTGGVLLLDGPERPKRFFAAGILMGLAAATRPNVILAGALATTVPYLRRLRRKGRLSLTVVAGVVVGVAPVTLLNVAASGEPVLLTTSGGHNFYIGHNPQARAQYSLPPSLDGDVFENMKALAEGVEGRPLEDTEVSGWYFGRAVAHIAEDPGRELGLLARRTLLLFNDFEATTYANYEYQKAYSPLLRWAPTLGWLLLLAAPGMLLALRRSLLHLWIPFLTAALSVFLFFFIARLRIVMAPSLGIFAGAAVARAVELLGRRERTPAIAAAGVGLVAAALSALPLLRADTSNEWNKAGGVLRAAGRYAEAEQALERARTQNPDNPNTFLNLAALYRETGREEEATAAEERARTLGARGTIDARSYRRGLEGGR